MAHVSTTLSCPQCGTAMRPDQGWCGLCYARPEDHFDPLTAPLEEVLHHSDPTEALELEGSTEVVEDLTPVASAPDALLEPVEVPSGPPEPSTTGEAPKGPLSDVDVMLSMLAAEHRQSDRTVEVLDRFDDKATRILIMVGGTAVIAVLSFALMALLGAVF